MDWKQIEIIVGQDAEAHIRKHGVNISEVFNVLNGLTYSPSDGYKKLYRERCKT